MATVNKNFKIKSGLVVEGTTGTINGENILTENASDQYIIDLIGGETLVTSVDSDQLQVINGELSVKDNVFDVDGAAAAAQTAAEEYADGLAGNYDPAGSSSTVQTNLDNHALDTSTHGVTGAIVGTSDTQTLTNKTIDSGNNTITVTSSNVSDFNTAALSATSAAYDAAGAASTAETNANNYTDTELGDYTRTADLDETIDGYGYLKSADLSSYATESYVNTAVDNLVDGAPGLLDTLNELAAAIADDENYATTMTTALAGKQGTLTAGSNIDITADTISVTGLASTDISDFNTAALSATSSAYDAAGSAGDVQDNLDTHTNASSAHGVSGDIVGTSDSQTLTNKTIDGNSNTISNIDNTSLVNYSIDVNGYTTNLGSSVTLDTDDIAEGTDNEYFTDSRAKDSAADLLTNATLSNITITGSGAGLTITAENGVAGSDTDDLTEGSTNLYFTNTRVIDAVDNADITPNTVQIDTFRKEEATRVSAGSTSTVNLHSFDYPYESAKYLVRVVGWVGGVKHSQLTEILMTVDGNNNIAISEYGTISTNDASLASFTATESAGVYTLTATVGSVSSCEIITAATLLSWAD